MNNNFSRALEKTLYWEGGFSDDENDRGGETYRGVSKRFLQLNKLDINKDGIVDKQDILDLQDGQVIAIYQKYFWDKLRCCEIVSFYVQRQLFDIGVNSGNRQAVKLIQKCCNSMGCNIVVDGLIGKNTLKAINSCNPYSLNNLLAQERDKFYNKLVVKNPKYQCFLRGWSNRCNAFKIDSGLKYVCWK